jgi:hypothetical protein
MSPQACLILPSNERMETKDEEAMAIEQASWAEEVIAAFDHSRLANQVTELLPARSLAMPSGKAWAGVRMTAA